MLDPLTALSIACSVIQIVDFGCKLVSQTQEVYQAANGGTKDNVTESDIVNDIKTLYRELAKKDDDFQRSSDDDIALGKLVDACNREATSLLELLAGLEAPKGATKWVSFMKAIKIARKRGQVEGIETRLRKIQRQIDSRLQIMMKYVSITLVD